MSDGELRIRARRLLSGDVRLEDLDRLFLDQRERCHGRIHFRELGDFLAHRSARDKGPVAEVIKDIMTSFRVWSMPMREERHTFPDIHAAGEANLRLVTEEQLSAGCGMRRQTAATKFRKGFSKLEAGRSLSQSEERAVQYLGNQFVWRPAFNDEQLLADFLHVLLRNGVITENQIGHGAELKTTLALYALSRMHETIITDKHGVYVQLFAGAAHSHGGLEVKLDINIQTWKKPIIAPICVFLTSLSAKEHCDETLPLASSAVEWNSWSYPIEIGKDRKLRRLT